LTGSDDGTAIVWDLRTLTELRTHGIEQACAAAGGGLTRAEWERWIPTHPYRKTC
jgi:hypothetical protein